MKHIGVTLTDLVLALAAGFSAQPAEAAIYRCKEGGAHDLSVASVFRFDPGRRGEREGWRRRKGGACQGACSNR